LSKICIIFNGYRRPEYLKKQIDAVQRQSIMPNEILYWQNTLEGVAYDESSADSLISARSNYNFGVWSRFAYALNSKSDYVCIFDDDTIPGKLWLENCLLTHKHHPGLLGTIGMIFDPPSSDGNINYRRNYRVGWDSPNNDVAKVDIVGHCWFFHRDLLSVFWRELPELDQSMRVGEDIHFSYVIQKYTTFGVYVPPHPLENKDMWGSLAGWEMGNDGRATASIALHEMMNTLDKYVKKGFKTLRSNDKY
jgi:hypothetical protein